MVSMHDIGVASSHCVLTVEHRQPINECVSVCEVMLNAFMSCLLLLLLSIYVEHAAHAQLLSALAGGRGREKNDRNSSNTHSSQHTHLSAAMCDWHMRDVSIRSSFFRHVRNRQVLLCECHESTTVRCAPFKFLNMKKRNLHTLIMHNSLAGGFCSQGNFTVVMPSTRLTDVARFNRMQKKRKW